MTTLSVTLRNKHGRFNEVVEYIRDWVNNSPELWETLDTCLVFGNRDKLGRGGHIHLTDCPVEVVDSLRSMLETDSWSTRQSAKDNFAGDKMRRYSNACLDWAYELEIALERADDEEVQA